MCGRLFNRRDKYNNHLKTSTPKHRVWMARAKDVVQKELAPSATGLHKHRCHFSEYENISSFVVIGHECDQHPDGVDKFEEVNWNTDCQFGTGAGLKEEEKKVVEVSWFVD